jgi:hypothetical protein
VLKSDNHGRTVALQTADFDLDGYPDLGFITQSSRSEEMAVILLKNNACMSGTGRRTFNIWDPVYTKSLDTLKADFSRLMLIDVDDNVRKFHGK